MEWQIGNIISFGGRAWVIKATMKDEEAKLVHFTLQGVDFPHKFMTVCRAA